MEGDPPRDPLGAWRELFDFTKSAEQEFLRLPSDIRARFETVFPEFALSPTRWTPSVDVAMLRSSKGRWRLKVEGDLRGVYRVVQGRALFETFQSRAEVYEWLNRFLGILI